MGRAIVIPRRLPLPLLPKLIRGEAPQLLFKLVLLLLILLIPGFLELPLTLTDLNKGNTQLGQILNSEKPILQYTLSKLQYKYMCKMLVISPNPILNREKYFL